MIKPLPEHINTIVKKSTPYLLGALLLVFYTTEAYSKITEFFTREYSILPRILKFVCTLVFSFIILIKSPLKAVKIIIIPIIIYITGNLFLPQSFTQNSIVTLGKYLYPLIIYTFFHQIKTNKTFLFNVFENLMLFNSLLILVGFVFGIELFKTYDGNRFGYNGLLLTSATSTYVYIITLFYFLLKNQQPQLFEDKKLLFILFSALFIGTKALYVSILFIVSLLIFKTVSPKNKKKVLFLSLTVAGILFYITFYKIGKFSIIREKHGLLSSILSYRNQLFLNDTLPFIKQNWSLPNYLFGGVNDIQTRTEMSLIDIFYFFGIFGGLWYLYIYYKTYVTFKKNFIINVFLILILLISTLAGNFFFYSTIPVYLLVLKEKILFTQRKNENTTIKHPY